MNIAKYAFSADYPEIYYVDFEKITIRVDTQGQGTTAKYYAYIGTVDGKSYYTENIVMDYSEKDEVNDIMDIDTVINDFDNEVNKIIGNILYMIGTVGYLYGGVRRTVINYIVVKRIIPVFRIVLANLQNRGTVFRRRNKGIIVNIHHTCGVIYVDDTHIAFIVYRHVISYCNLVAYAYGRVVQRRFVSRAV